MQDFLKWFFWYFAQDLLYELATNPNLYGKAKTVQYHSFLNRPDETSHLHQVFKSTEIYLNQKAVVPITSL